MEEGAKSGVVPVSSIAYSELMNTRKGEREDIVQVPGVITVNYSRVQAKDEGIARETGEITEGRQLQELSLSLYGKGGSPPGLIQRT